MTNLVRRILVVLLIIFLMSELTGCGPLQKKFTRKKKKEQTPPLVYYEPEEYVKESNTVLYKKHYIYWKTWHEELVNSIGENYKRDTRCVEEIIINLEDMKKFLVKEKADKLDSRIAEIRGLKKEISDKFMTLATRNRIKGILEKIYRNIKREFSYKKTKDYILP